MLEWTSPLIVHVRRLYLEYHEILLEFLRRNMRPPPPLVHQDVLQPPILLKALRKNPTMLYKKKSFEWLLPYIWASQDPWKILILGPSRIIRRCFKEDSEGALLACIRLAPDRLSLLLRLCSMHDLHACDEQGSSLLEITAQNPPLFRLLAKAGAPRDGARRAIAMAVGRGFITEEEGRSMRQTLRRSEAGQSRGRCWCF